MDNYVKFRRHEIGQRQVDTLIGLCKGVVADGKVNQAEAEFLYSWLVGNQEVINENPLIMCLLERIGVMLEDGILDQDESVELLSTLRQFSGNQSEIGEFIKTTSLPVDDPQPSIEFEGGLFLFTGTCAFGTRKQCKDAIEDLGGQCAKGVIQPLDYLVLGTYVTPSWKHETFGNKILKAIEYRDRLGNPAIVTEAHWVKCAGLEVVHP